MTREQEVSARGDLRPLPAVCNACAPPSLEDVASIVNFRCGVTPFAWSEAGYATPVALDFRSSVFSSSPAVGASPPSAAIRR
jgi:hypothetical protein